MKIKFILVSFLFLFSSCTFDTSGIKSGENNAVCGNGTVEEGEDCEPGVNFTETCESFAFKGGELTCNTMCKFDTSSCEAACGECVIGKSKCSNNTIYSCTDDGAGCGQWSEGENCGTSSLFCIEDNGNASCENSCQSNCTNEGALQCDDVSNSIEKCELITAGSTSCLIWTNQESCLNGNVCEYNSSVSAAACVPECTQDELKCSDDNYKILQCSKDATGFTAWVVNEDCNASTTDASAVCLISDGAPVCQVCSYCTQGDTRCSSDGLHIETCTLDATTNCTYWEESDSCLFGTVCDVTGSGDATCASCLDCTVDDTRCNTNSPETIETCEATGNGCTVWVASACPDGSECNGSLVPAECSSCMECTAGTYQCSSDYNSTEICSSYGNGCTAWATDTTCTVNSDHLQQCVDNGAVSCEEMSMDCGEPYVVTELPFGYSSDINRFDDVIDFTANCYYDTDNGSNDESKEVFFSLYMNAGEYVLFEENGGMDSILRIIEESDFCSGTNTCIDEIDSDFSEVLEFNAPSDGTYIFVVEAFNSGDVDPSSLHVSIIPPVCTEYETEANNNPSDANADMPNIRRNYCHSFTAADEWDCVKMNIPSPGGSIDLSTHSAYGAACTWSSAMYFVDSDGQILIPPDSLGHNCPSIKSGDPVNILFADVIPADEYTICLNSDESSDSSLLALEINKNPTLKTIVFNENFKTTYQPAGWSIDSKWNHESGEGFFGTNHTLKVESDTNETGRWNITTNALDLSGLHNVKLRFMEKSDFGDYYQSYDVVGYVLISSNDFSSNTVVQVNSDKTAHGDWTINLIDLEPALANSKIDRNNVKIRFRYFDNNSYRSGYWEVDNIMVFGD